MINPLQILLLGPPEIRWEGKLLSIRRRFPRALLFYLAWRGGMVGRNELLTLFWEEEKEKEARSRLRETLSRLRQSLPDPALLVAESDLIGLDPAAVYIDHTEFQRLLALAGRVAWNSPVQQPLPEYTILCLRQAATLWRGPRFMAGVELPDSNNLENWLSDTAQHLEVLYVRLLERLAGHAEAVDDLEQCLNDTLQAVKIDDLDENIHERLMRVLIRMGRRDQARRHYLALSKRMEHEIGIEPAQALRELYQQACDNTRPLRPPKPVMEWNIHPSPDIPFVGRQAMLAQLVRCYEQGQNVIVVGEAGAGKTRLVREFVDRLQPKPDIVVGRCKPGESDKPLQAYVDVERRYGLGIDVWRDVPAALVGQIFPFIPEVARVRPDLLQADNLLPELDHTSIFEAIRQLLIQLTRERRLITVLDDLQWADAMSLEALAALLERPPFNYRAMFVATLRSDESSPKIDRLVKPLQESGRLVVIELPNLTLSEVNELAQKITTRPIPPQWVNRLSRFTGGNVLYTLKTLEALPESLPDLSEDDDFPLESSVAAILRNRLSALPEHARRLLDSAAIIGAEFDPELIAEIRQVPVQSLEEGLAVLAQRLLIEPVPRSPARSCYRFIHEMVRQVILDGLPPLQKQNTHRRAAQALETMLGERVAEQADRLASHYERAGDALSAFRYYAKAGIDLHQRHRPVTETTQAFANAERMLEAIKFQISDAELYHWYKNWFDLAYEVHEISTLQRLTAPMLELGWQRHSPLLIGGALTGLGKIALANTQLQEGLNDIHQALPYLKQSDHLAAYVEAYQHQAIFYYLLNRLDEAQQVFQQALALCVESHDPEVVGVRADIYYQLGIVQTLMGRPKEGQKYASLALSDTLTAKRAAVKTTVYNLLALAQYLQGDYAQARRDDQFGVEIAERVHFWRILGYLHITRSMIELSAGNIGAALRFSMLGLEIGERNQHADLICYGYATQADIFARLQAYPPAIRAYQRSLEASQEGFWGLNALMRLGDTLCRAGQSDPGQATLRQAIDLAEASQLGLISIYGRSYQLARALDQADWEHAEAVAEQLHTAAQQHGLRPLSLENLHCRGLIARYNDDHEQAMTHFSAAACEAATLPNPWIEIRALVSLIELRQALGRSTVDLRRQLSNKLDSLAATLPDDTTFEENRLVCEAFRAFRSQFDP